jgi:hypothetical protein
MMTETAETPRSPSPPRPPRDRLIKWAFVGLIVLAVVAVVLMQQKKTLGIKGWSNDLSQTLATARTDNRRVVAFFVRQPSSHTAKTIARHAIQPANVEAIDKGRFLPVVVTTEPGSEPATTYGIEAFPTLLVLSPQGEEMLRREGLIGEVPFRQEFLEKVPAVAKTNP